MQQMKLFLFSIMCEAFLELWKKVAATLLVLRKKQHKDKENILNQITDVKNYVDKESNI